MTAMTCKIAISANSAWYLANFRLNLAKALQDAGCEVIAVGPPGADAARIEAAGVRFISVPMSPNSMNPLRDIDYFMRLFRILQQERPSACLSYTVKPNVYGGMACRLLGIPAILNIAGLGSVFIRDGWLARAVQLLYRLGMSRAYRVFFQNPDDMEMFLRRGLVTLDQSDRLPGSGVDLEHFSPVPLPEPGAHAPFRFLLIARLLWDKGIGEFVEAARQLRAEGRAVECQLLGFLGSENPSAVPPEEVEAWERDGVITHLGTAEDVRPHIANADCVVLPSYREGTPRSLLEAAAMARPIITTDSVGCREVVDDGSNGFLCRPRDAAGLADKMRRMMDLPHPARAEMGQMGRKKMVREFDESIVIDRYLQAVKKFQ